MWFLKNKDAKNILVILRKNHIKYIILVPIDNKNSYTIKELEIISSSLGIKYYSRNSIKKAITSDLIKVLQKF